jgi:hypothetical protein
MATKIPKNSLKNRNQLKTKTILAAISTSSGKEKEKKHLVKLSS